MTPRPYGDNFVLAVRKYLHDNSLKSLGQINAEILADLAQRFQDHYAGQQKAKKKSGDATPEELAIYDLYPRKVARADAIEAIRYALNQTDRETLSRATQLYASCVGRWPKSYRFNEGRDLVPYPATWFRAGRWSDDPKEWLPAGMFTREDDAGDKAPGHRAVEIPLSEPQGWNERVKGHEDLGVFEGRLWESINPYYQKQIIKLCSP